MKKSWNIVKLEKQEEFFSFFSQLATKTIHISHEQVSARWSLILIYLNYCPAVYPVYNVYIRHIDIKHISRLI